MMITMRYRVPGQATERRVVYGKDREYAQASDPAWRGQFDTLAAGLPWVNLTGYVDATLPTVEAATEAEALPLAIAAAQAARAKEEEERARRKAEDEAERAKIAATWIPLAEAAIKRAREIIAMSPEERELLPVEDRDRIGDPIFVRLPPWNHLSDHPKVEGEDRIYVAQSAATAAWKARTIRVKAEAEAKAQAERATYLALLPLDPNQRRRLAADVLPESEILEAARELEFGGVDLPVYEPAEDEDVPECGCGAVIADGPDWRTESPDALTAAEFDALEAVKAAVPAQGARVDLVHKVGTNCGAHVNRECSHLRRAAVRVRIATPVGEIRREYAVDQDDVIKE